MYKHIAYNESDDFLSCEKMLNKMYEMFEENNIILPDSYLALDIGGGGGMQSGLLTSDHRLQKIYCTDIINENLLYNGEFVKLLDEKFARNKRNFQMGKFEFICASATDLPFRNGLFDLIISFNSFEHIPNPQAALYEIERTLRNGGIAYITFDPVWTADSGSHLYDICPIPWQHLLVDDHDFCELILKNGGNEDDCHTYMNSMNRKGMKYYKDILSNMDGMELIELKDNVGVSKPENIKHNNLNLCINKGYSMAELFYRGSDILIKKT